MGGISTSTKTRQRVEEVDEGKEDEDKETAEDVSVDEEARGEARSGSQNGTSPRKLPLLPDQLNVGTGTGMGTFTPI
jgi:hypothetical protein